MMNEMKFLLCIVFFGCFSSAYSEDRAVPAELLKLRTSYEAEIVKAGAMSIRELEGTEWQWASGGTLRFEENGKATHTAWSTPGIWKKVNSVSITLQRPGGDPPMTVVFSDQRLNEAVITSHLGTSTTITRIK